MPARVGRRSSPGGAQWPADAAGQGKAMTFLMILYVAVGLLLSGLSLPLIWGKVGPNPWYDFRVRRTLEDPAVWYPANAYAAKGLLCVGLATCAAAVLLYLVPGIALGVYAGVVGAVVLAGLAVCLVLSFRYLAAVAGREERGG